MRESGSHRPLLPTGAARHDSWMSVSSACAPLARTSVSTGNPDPSPERQDRSAVGLVERRLKIACRKPSLVDRSETLRHGVEQFGRPYYDAHGLAINFILCVQLKAELKSKNLQPQNSRILPF